jgi:hypothetical protein
MKNGVLSLLLCLPFCGFAQNAFPLFSQKPTWRVSVESMTSFVAPYLFVSDTLFEGKTYSRVLNYDFLVRNEGKKTWIRVVNFSTKKYSREFLLYDFDLKQGDSTKVGPQTFSIPQPSDSTITIKVESVDSVTIGNVRRKRLKINYPRCGNYQRLSTMEWVEGIGSFNNPFYSALCLCDGCEQSYKLLCFKLDTTQVYLLPGYPSCDFIRIGTNDINASNIEIFPNPFTNQIILRGAENIEKAYIFAADGRLIKTINVAASTSLSLADVPVGLYWFKFFDAKGIHLSTQKVVKMNP